jgi:GT2 family glycosyltransferase
MISVVCVYSDEQVLRGVLLRALKSQTVEHELIMLDNRKGRFKSAAEALNYGGGQAKGEYIVFVHQDMWLASDSFLEEAERVLATIPDLGIAGVAGQTESGRSWGERCRWSIEEADELLPLEGRESVQIPEVVQTLDECLLAVPRAVFERLKFDEETFDGWDCYGADYCLSVRKLGLRAWLTEGASKSARKFMVCPSMKRPR